jgi:hypothetical protein
MFSGCPTVAQSPKPAYCVAAQELSLAALVFSHPPRDSLKGAVNEAASGDGAVSPDSHTECGREHMKCLQQGDQRSVALLPVRTLRISWLEAGLCPNRTFDSTNVASDGAAALGALTARQTGWRDRRLSHDAQTSCDLKLP